MGLLSGLLKKKGSKKRGGSKAPAKKGTRQSAMVTDTLKKTGGMEAQTALVKPGSDMSPLKPPPGVAKKDPELEELGREAEGMDDFVVPDETTLTEHDMEEAERELDELEATVVPEEKDDEDRALEELEGTGRLGLLDKLKMKREEIATDILVLRAKMSLFTKKIKLGLMRKPSRKDEVKLVKHLNDLAKKTDEIGDALARPIGPDVDVSEDMDALETEMLAEDLGTIATPTKALPTKKKSALRGKRPKAERAPKRRSKKKVAIPS